MRGQGRAGVFFKTIKNFFALAEAIKKWSQGADVQGMRAEPQEVAGDSLQLRQYSSNHARPEWSFGQQQFLHRLAISQAAADGCDIVHAVDIGSKLLIRSAFRAV